MYVYMVVVIIIIIIMIGRGYPRARLQDVGFVSGRQSHPKARRSASFSGRGYQGGDVGSAAAERGESKGRQTGVPEPIGNVLPEKYCCNETSRFAPSDIFCSTAPSRHLALLICGAAHGAENRVARTRQGRGWFGR